jgi:hypothetical protein
MRLLFESVSTMENPLFFLYELREGNSIFEETKGKIIERNLGGGNKCWDSCF